jgi:septum formation topological specificity factor MinE
MGEIVSGRKMPLKKYIDSQLPILLCDPKSFNEDEILGSGYQRYSLNLPLAEELVKKSDADRVASVRETVLALIPRHSPVYLTDYEMLFDSRYSLDVLKLFIEISRRQKLAVRWCGKLTGKTLFYSEPDHPDYKRYSVADYDITCIS